MHTYLQESTDFVLISHDHHWVEQQVCPEQTAMLLESVPTPSKPMSQNRMQQMQQDP